jgi:F0F1-type ATP synthase assembly protein I
MDRSPDTRRRMWQELDDGWTTTVELMTAVGVWMAIGWLLDTWLGTWPWLMVVGAFLGFVLGVYLAWVRHQRHMQESAPDRFRTVDAADDVGPAA